MPAFLGGMVDIIINMGVETQNISVQMMTTKYITYTAAPWLSG